jgi:Tfp pilus assembly protein PilF
MAGAPRQSIRDDLAMPVARISLAVLAVCACAWFSLGVVQSHATDAASSVVSGNGKLSPGQAARARSELGTASTLNPDHSIDLLRARLAVREGRSQAAIAILRRTVAAEPRNLLAWLALAQTALLAHNRRVLDMTISRLASLDPKLR